MHAGPARWIWGIPPVMLWALLSGMPAASADSGTTPASLFAESMRLANEATSRLGSNACSPATGCDATTGCIPPAAAKEPRSESAPSDPDGSRLRALQLYAVCRAIVREQARIRDANLRLFSFGAARAADSQFAADVIALNGDIFWAPASKSSSIITRFGDEARAVFGPIPDIDCTDAAKTTHQEVEGNQVDLKPNPNKPGMPLEFEHRNPAGQVVKWTATLPRCDKITLTQGFKDTFCGINNRLNRTVRGGIEWVALCRKTDEAEVTAKPFWLASNPTFSLLGMYGFNPASGEAVFFDGREDGSTFDWSKPFVPPGGRSYDDDVGRTAAEGTYDRYFTIECSFCHDSKNLHIVDPDIHLARVGYRDDAIRDAFSIENDYLPQITRREDAPFRVVGTEYTATYAADLADARTVRDPTGNCRGCHVLTTQMTGQRFAPDAVGKAPFMVGGTKEQQAYLQQETDLFDAEVNHRTEWTLATGPGKIHPWMVPHDGNDLTGTPEQMSDADWEKLSNCLWATGGAECGYKPLYTKCPAPESTAVNAGDPAAPAAVAAIVIDRPDGSTPKAVRLTWKYLNALGSVPERDDVRFNVVVKEAEIPAGGGSPQAGEFPAMSEAEGQDLMPVTDEIGRVGEDWLIQNASYAGHIKWTEPVAATSPRDYRVDIPASCGKRYLMRISPKRFCFDASGELFSSVEHTAFVDVVCN